MTPDARAWYREEAERWGLSTRLRINPDCIDSLNEIAWAARLAGHFGRLALEQTMLW